MKPPARVSPKPRRSERRVFSRRRRSVWSQMVVALGCLGAGLGLLAGLQQLVLRLDAVLLVSEALSHLIGGFTNVGLGLAQLLGVLLMVLTIAAALLLVLSGLIRLVRALLPGHPQPGAPQNGNQRRPSSEPRQRRTKPRGRP